MVFVILISTANDLSTQNERKNNLIFADKNAPFNFHISHYFACTKVHSREFISDIQIYARVETKLTESYIF